MAKVFLKEEVWSDIRNYTNNYYAQLTDMINPGLHSELEKIKREHLDLVSKFEKNKSVQREYIVGKSRENIVAQEQDLKTKICQQFDTASRICTYKPPAEPLCTAVQVILSYARLNTDVAQDWIQARKEYLNSKQIRVPTRVDVQIARRVSFNRWDYASLVDFIAFSISPTPPEWLTKYIYDCIYLSMLSVMDDYEDFKTRRDAAILIELQIPPVALSHIKIINHKLDCSKHFAGCMPDFNHYTLCDGKLVRSTSTYYTIKWRFYWE